MPPSRTDGSLGRRKIDLAPPADRTHYIWAEEYNRAADAIIENAESIEAIQAALALAPDRFNLFDDFEGSSLDSRRWHVDAFGSGAGADADDLGGQVTSAGCGWLVLEAPSDPSGTVLVGSFGCRRAGNPEIVVRLRLPGSDVAHWQVSVRLVNDAATSHATVRTKSSGVWEARSASGTEASSSAADIAESVAEPGGLYVVRLTFSDGDVAVQVDQPDEGESWTHTIASGLPVPDDGPLVPAVSITRLDGSGGTTYLDYVRFRGTR